MLLKAHSTLHSKMPGSRWVITPSSLFGSWRSFLHSSSVYSCHLFLISSASVMSIPFLWLGPLLCHLCFKCSLGISNFLEEISSLSQPIVFFYFFVLITEEDFISPSYSLELCIKMGITLLFSFAFHVFSSQLFVRPPQTTILPFYIFFPFWGWSWSLPPIQYHEPLSIVLQALYQI